MGTLSGSPLVFTITTIGSQSIIFYLGFPSAYLFTAKSEQWMPMYMLMHPFLFLASRFAMTHFPDLEDPNTVFMQVTTDPAAHWLVGIVAAGAGLA